MLAGTILALWPSKHPPDPPSNDSAAGPIVIKVSASERQEVYVGFLRNYARHEFTCRLVNDSSSEVRIESFNTSCECATVKIAKDYLAPGEQTTCVVTVDLEHSPGSGRLWLTADAAVTSGSQTWSMGIDVRARVAQP